MARLSPEQKIRRIANAISAWETHARRSTFSRHTLNEFKVAMQPALDAHARVAQLRKDLRVSLHERDGAVRKALQLVELVRFAAKGHPAHGANSAMCDALGFTREAVRRGRIRVGMGRKRARSG